MGSNTPTPQPMQGRARAVTIPLLPITMHMLMMEELRASVTTNRLIGMHTRADAVLRLISDLDKRACVVTVINNEIAPTV